MKNTNQESDVKKSIHRQRRALRKESFRKFCRRFRKNKGSVVGLAMLSIIILIAVLAPIVAPYGPFYNHFTPKSSPGTVNWLGTDELGRDVLSRVIYGSRVSLLVGLAASALATVLGVVVGCLAGYGNRNVSTLLLKTTETFQMLPMFFVAILLSAAFGPSLGLVVGVVGFMSWPSCARIVRGEFLSLREKEFVTAAKSIGCGKMSIVFQEIFPSVIPQVIVNASMRMATAIMLEATLNFFGCGDPLRVSWGKMLNDSRTYLRSAPWASIFPGIAILITVLSINLVGDGLNDALNPKFRER